MFAKGKPSHIEHVYLVRSYHVSNAIKLSFQFDSCIFLKQYLFTNVFTVFVYKYSHNMFLQIFSQYLFTNILLVFVYQYSHSICLQMLSAFSEAWRCWPHFCPGQAGRPHTLPLQIFSQYVVVNKYSDNICYEKIFLHSMPLQTLPG